jgi:ubiquinone/menaquinone biosynthesis C-methylase UbiE
MPSANTAASPGNAGVKYVNLGCGSRFHKEWTNVDMVSAGPEVIQHNIIGGLPFRDATVDVIYHSHVLEHLPKSKAPGFIQECYRVLKPGGIIRVVVPDLEQIAREYIRQLDRAVNMEAGASDNYDWMMLELLDQCVRNETGGEMGKYLKQENIPNEAFIYQRVGNEAKAIREAFKSNPHRKTGIKRKVRSLLHKVPFMHHYLDGTYRSQGEIHQWMYDRFSLSRLLTEAGFTRVKVQTAFESYISNWSSYGLDSKDGTVHKPDSLFIEAIKP